MWIGGLPWHVNENLLLQQVMRGLKLPPLKLKVQQGDQHSYCFVTVTDEEEARGLVQHMHLAKVQGNMVNCRLALPKGEKPVWQRAPKAQPKVIPSRKNPPKDLEQEPKQAQEQKLPEEQAKQPEEQPEPASPATVVNEDLQSPSLSHSEPTMTDQGLRPKAAGAESRAKTAESRLKMQGHLGSCEGKGLYDPLFHGSEVVKWGGGLCHSRPKVCPCCWLECTLCKIVFT